MLAVVDGVRVEVVVRLAESVSEADSEQLAVADLHGLVATSGCSELDMLRWLLSWAPLRCGHSLGRGVGRARLKPASCRRIGPFRLQNTVSVVGEPARMPFVVDVRW